MKVAHKILDMILYNTRETTWKKFKELLPVLSSRHLSFQTCGRVYSPEHMPLIHYAKAAFLMSDERYIGSCYTGLAMCTALVSGGQYSMPVRLGH